MSRRTTRLIAAGIILPLLPPLLFIGFFGVLLAGGSSSGTSPDPCIPANLGGASIVVSPGPLPKEAIAGYRDEQLANAAAILTAGADMKLSPRDQTIGVMTAMGESSLRVLDHGDMVGPDSRGLFQQRDNGAWGTYADRMDPYRSARAFFKRLQTIQGRDQLAPTKVAHLVQINANEDHYAKYWNGAVQIVEGLSGTKTGLAVKGGLACFQTMITPIAESFIVKPGRWTRPALGDITSPYGLRTDPRTGKAGNNHRGVDIISSNRAIFAARSGIVHKVHADQYGGWMIDIDHGSGVMTRYKHMWQEGINVKKGDQITSGQRIGTMGSSGYSTGTHLHFEVHVNEIPVNPQTYLARHGVEL